MVPPEFAGEQPVDGCLDEPTVAAWLDGNLTEDHRIRAERHLDSCPPCLELIAELGRASIGSAPTRSPDEAAQTLWQTPVAAAPERQPDGGPRYRIGSLLSAGGMGRIYRAEDTLLGRPVALKLLLTPDSRRLVARFCQEMAITARLQHPAIVPIYDAGTLPDGQPFYAMRMIAGSPLDALISERSTWTERLELLPAVMTAVDAVAFAHEQGVIHRDLKPQNIVVGDFGETVVLDWGLAKEIGSGETDSADRKATSAVTTRFGQVLGTPGYMAPEQAHGQPADTRSDVYGLGGILYHLLSGSAPHVDDEQRERVEARVPIEERITDLPAGLAAIVERALARRARDRYQSAGELAEDLRRFQAGQLVRAHNYSTWELFSRWLRRNRVAVAAAAIALVAIAVVSTVAVVRVVESRQHAQEQRLVAEVERERADRERLAAEELVDFTVEELREKLDSFGRLDLLVGLGTELDRYYNRVSRGETSTPSTLLRRGKALALLGEARRWSGDADGALEALQASARHFATAVERMPDVDAREGLCRAQVKLADAYFDRGMLDQAAAGYRDCMRLAQEVPDPSPAWRNVLLKARVSDALVTRERGDLDEATAVLTDALAAAESLRADAPDHDNLRLLVKISDDLGMIAYRRGLLDEAQRHFQVNVDRTRAAHERAPADPDTQSLVTVAVGKLGVIAEARGDLDGAEKFHRESLRLSEELVAHDPGNALWLRIKGVNHDSVASTCLAAGRIDEAIEELGKSREIATRLRAMFPNNAKWGRDLAVTEQILGTAHQEAGNLTRARDQFQRSLDILTELQVLNPNRPYGEELGVVCLMLGDVQLELGARAAGVELIERGLEYHRQLIAIEDSPATRARLANDLAYMAERIDDRRAAYRDEARAVLEPVVDRAGDNPQIADLLDDLAKP